MKFKRNDPCLCGSGKKYKKCCLDSVAPADLAVKAGAHPEAEHDDEHFYNYLEAAYDDESSSTIFALMKLLTLDSANSDPQLVEAVAHYIDKDGQITEDAPTAVFTEDELAAICRDGGFRPKLYAMLLAKKFGNSIENKRGFLQHSYRYGYNPE